MRFIIAILIFSVIILFHEFGHFLLAKKNGIEVVEFSLGMGPKLLSTKYKGTRYSLKALPLGGSCMMLGEDGEDKSPGTFNAANVWARISVIAAGPVFNFIFAFVFSVIIVALIGEALPVVTEVSEDSPAYEAGLREGDMIREFNGYNVNLSKDLSTYTAVVGLENEPVNLKVKRNGENLSFTYNPDFQEVYLLGFNRSLEDGSKPLEVISVMKGLALDEAGIVQGDIITSINGVEIASSNDYDAYITENPLSDQPIELTYEHRGASHKVTITPSQYDNVSMGFQYNFLREKGTALQTLKYGAQEVSYWIRTTVLSLKELVTGKYGVKDLSGPVGVVDIIGDTYEESRQDGTLWVWVNMLNMAVLLSANLGVMNLLPIPALDGGRLVFLAVEAVTKKSMNRQVEGMIHFAGLVLLMILMVVVMFNDVLRLF